MRNSWSWKLAVIFSAVLPPLVMGTMRTLSFAQELFFPHEISALADPLPPGVTRPASRQQAVILMGLQGAQVSETLLAYETLASDKNWEVRLAAPVRKPLPLTSGLAVLPDLTFDQIQKMDLLVIPSQLHPAAPELQAAIQRLAPHARTVLILGEGARAVAQTGLLDGVKTTSHFFAFHSLQKTFPRVQWQEKYTSLVTPPSHPNHPLWISSFGLALTPLAVRDAMESLKNPALANRPLADGANSQSISASEALRLFLNGGFDWHRKGLGVWMTDGVSESTLAALLDTYPRTFSARVVPLAAQRKLLRSKHGLLLIPAIAIQDAPTLDAIWVPESTAEAFRDPVLLQWAKDWKVPVRTLSADQPFIQAVEHLADDTDAPSARWVAHVMGLPEPTSKNSRWWLWLHPIAVGFAGVLLVKTFRKRWLGRAT